MHRGVTETLTPGGELGRAARAGAIYLALTLVLAWPLVRHPASSAMPGDPDTDLFMWTLAWNTHALTTDPLSVFDANIYFPHRRTLAFSENLLGSTLFAAPVLWTTGDPLLALNVVALFSIALSGVGAYVLARRLGLGVAGAVVCGLVFAFSPARFFRLGQIHLATIHWVPFCLAFLHAYLDAGRRRDLHFAIAFFSLQALTSGHGAVFLVTATACLLAYRLLFGEPIAPVRRMKDVGLTGALLAAPALLVVVPYRYVQNEFGLKRSLDGWETPASSFLSPLTPLHTNVFAWAGISFDEPPSAYLFPGLLAVILALVACLPHRDRLPAAAAAPADRRWPRLAGAISLLAVASSVVALYIHIEGPIRMRAGGTLLFSARDPLRPWIVAAAAAGARLLLLRRVPLDIAEKRRHLLAVWRRHSDVRRRDARTFYALLTLLCILLAAGPPIGLWPLVYDLPGFNFLRVPSRFMLLAVLGLAVLAAIGFERLTSRAGGRGRAIAAVFAGGVLVAECFTMPLPGHRPYSVVIPGADRWLATQPAPLVIAELPSDHHNERRQSTYMLHSMAHWQKTVHGHSGIRTPLHRDLYEKLRGFPSAASLDALTALGVTHIVIHPGMYDPQDWARASAGLPAFRHRLSQVYDDGEGQVYLLRPPAGP
ncbi:MAG TPA: hypothetical protein VJ813_15460 [Vicinamibacterales bacterium]|nr:hypothetical protein [Vicinamibacterales bacterium]